MTESDAAELPHLKPGKYLHVKSGHFYEVVGVALQTETNEWLVIYRPLWDCEYPLFARPYSMFTEEVVIDGKMTKRFVKVAD